MSRPKSRRLISTPPLHSSFKPVGARGRDLKTVQMSLDEYEAIRLADYEGMSQDEAALEMDISRSTFSRLVESARRKSAELLLEGVLLMIDGGPVHFKENRLRCRDCGTLIPVRIGGSVSVCTNCGSSELVDLAGGFGHGACCSSDGDSRDD